MIRFSLLLVVVGSAAGFAEYGPVDTEQVPVERVIKNLTLAVEATDGGSGAMWLALGRAHAMAATQSTGELTVVATRGLSKPSPESWVWFGHEPPLVPFAWPTRAALPVTAAAHLKAALSAYERADSLMPGSAVVLMGKGWLLARMDRRADAITALKRAYDVLRAQTTPQSRLGLDPILEVIGYLTPLLDPQRDATLLAELESTRKDRAKLGRMITPLIIPLAKTTTLSDAIEGAPLVTFDADGSGLRRTWTWITPRAGWLVYAPNGTVDSALQLFGSVTFWLFFPNGYDALSVLDDDHDGRIAGNEQRGLSVWVDADGDAVTDVGELHSLPSVGITSVACTGARATRAPRVTAMHDTGVTFSDGSTRPTWDVVLSSPAMLSAADSALPGRETRDRRAR